MMDLNQTCRLSSVGKQLSVDLFRSVSCVQCLLYIFLAQPPYNYTINNVCDEGIMICDTKMPDCDCESSSQQKYNLLEFSVDKQNVLSISDMSLDPKLPEMFESTVRECCEAAKNCCENKLKFDRHEKGFCPATWDGWSCFERSEPGEIKGLCPNYVFGQRYHQKNDDMAVIKTCNSNGQWDGIQQNGIVIKERTNYRNCHQEEVWLRPLLTLTFIIYCLSSIALLPALIVISCNRRLKNYSIFAIHRQLLLTIFLSSNLYIINALLFMPIFRLRADLFLQNHIVCRLLFILQFAYLRLTSFAWMLVEALHLYWLLFQANSQMTELSNQVLILTWGIPLILTLIYSILLEFYANDVCMPETNNQLIGAIITIPCALCLFINMAILIATLRLLLEKLKTSNQNHSNLHNYKKILRALIVLIPLFGINLIFDVYSDDSNVYDILTILLKAINGLLLSIVVCYANKTVIHFIVESLKHFDLNSDFRLIRLSVSDYFRSHSIGCHHSENNRLKTPAANIRFASI